MALTRGAKDMDDTTLRETTAASHDYAWVRGLSNETLAKLETSQRSDDRDKMIARYMRAHHSARVLRAAGIKLYA